MKSLGVESLDDYLCFFTYSFPLEELKWCIDLSLIVLLFLLTCRDWPLIFFLIMCFWLLGEWVPVLIWLSKELSLFSSPTKEVISWTFFTHKGLMVLRARYYCGDFSIIFDVKSILNWWFILHVRLFTCEMKTHDCSFSINVCFLIILMSFIFSKLLH